MWTLVGKRTVVTGASSGIGQATAIALAHAGARVASLYLTDPEGAERTRQEIANSGSDALMVQGSTTDTRTVEAFAKHVEEEWGGIDVWVNNAGKVLVQPFLEMSEEEWQDILATNLHGYLNGCRAAARRMIAQGNGRIINITSVVSRQPISGMTAYVTSKAAVLGLTKALALELSSRGVTVNAVAPGAVDTPLSHDHYTPDVRRAYEERIALGRIAAPSDIAAAVLFLASDASGYITGHELLVDGGLSINGNMGFASST